MSLHWTEQDLEQYLRRGQPAPVTAEAFQTARSRPWAPYRSRTEQRYAGLLDVWHRDGMLQRWRYEAVRLTLAPQTTITVDFVLTMACVGQEGQVQFHEVKGGWFREDGWVKLKTAAALYPEWRFVRVQWRQGAWVWRDVQAT